MNTNKTIVVYFILLFILLSASSLALAETKYVTDKIVLELHKTKSSLSELIEQLPSGSPLTILETDGAYSRVEANDGKSGWVESAYLMNDKPAQLLYSELQQEHKRSLALIESLKNDIASSGQSEEDIKNIGWMRAELKKARDRAKNLESVLTKNNKQLGESRGSSQQLENKISDLQTQLKAAEIDNEENMQEITRLIREADDEAFFITAGLQTEIPLIWFLIGISVFLIIGIAAGALMFDAHYRKRHGGFRI